MHLLFNGEWTFLETAAGTDYKEAMGRLEDFQPVQVPHDWLIFDAEDLYRDGTGWYFKKVHFDREMTGEAGKKVFLCFDGIYMDSVIYVNDEKVGEWKYGYSPITLDITGQIKEGENRFAVSVTYQSPNTRWYSGAGLFRDVQLMIAEETYIPHNGIYAHTCKENGHYCLRVETELATLREDVSDYAMIPNIGNYQVDYSLLDASGKQVDVTKLTETYRDAEDEVCDATGNPEIRTVKVSTYCMENVEEWDPEHPCLYTLQARLLEGDKVLQEETCHIGFREVITDPEKGLLLNGRPFKLHGVCEHHDLGALGAAFHKEAMARKMEIIKTMGVNAIRLTHNMAAEGVLELADEKGILLISEAFDMWERPKTTYDYARFFPQWYEKDVAAWIRRDRNHPSVIFWSIGNEI
nr:glycoside hydrolase family 2 [Lachnospiraceae bacterium]